MFQVNRTLLLFRNRKMGKTLFLDCLNCYYNLNFKEKSEQIFTNLAVQKHQSALKNSMYVLVLDFSSIRITNCEVFNKSLDLEINRSIQAMKKKFKFLSDLKIEKNNCSMTLKNLATIIESRNSSLLILIDEYDTSINRFFNKSEEFEKLKSKNNTESEEALFIFRTFFATLKKFLKYPKIYLYYWCQPPITQ